MVRLSSLAKGSYYPFATEYIPAVASLFQAAPRGGLCLDACAGEGEALERLAKALGLTPYANELDHDRAATCRARLGIERTVQGDIFTLRTSHNAFGLQWCNPPYSLNKAGEERRRELEFLKHAWRWTQPGGYTIWVVYAAHMTKHAARFLLSNSDQVDVYRVPGLHLGAYPQIVVVARKTEPHEVEDQTILDLAARCGQPDELPPLEVVDEPRYRLPEPAKVRRFHFHPDQITPDVMHPALEEYGAHRATGFQAVVAPPPPPPPLAPIVPPRGGQIGLILAAGLFDGLVLDLPEEGEVVKGVVPTPAAVRGVVRMVEINTAPPGLEGVRETFEIRPQVTVTLLHRSGKVAVIRGEDEATLVRFLKDHREAFLQYLDAHSTPVYDFNVRRVMA